MRIFLEFEVRRLDCRHCGQVKRERLEFLATNPRYTKRFAFELRDEDYLRLKILTCRLPML